MYNRELIEEGLYSMWDRDLGFGSTKADDPSSDMPKAPRGDPSHGGTILAVRADLSRAWDRAPLTDVERRRVFLAYGACWTPRMLSEYEGAARQVCLRSVESGLSKITRFLNGDEEDEYGEHDFD